MPSSQDDSRSAVYHFLDVTDRDLRDKTTALLEAGTSFAIRSEASFKHQDKLRRTLPLILGERDHRAPLRSFFDMFPLRYVLLAAASARVGEHYSVSAEEDARGICIYFDRH